MISVKNLYKDFKSLRVLDGVSLDIKRGEKIVIIGASGSGKSTLLRCLNFLEEPTSGEIRLDDKLLGQADPYLHDDVILCSRTYQKLAAGRTEQMREEILSEIKEKKLLRRHEGAEYAKKKKAVEKREGLDINLARQRMGMVFQQFNLFNNLTVMQNLTLAPTQLKLMTREQADAAAVSLLRRIGLEDKAKAANRHYSCACDESRGDAVR